MLDAALLEALEACREWQDGREVPLERWREIQAALKAPHLGLDAARNRYNGREGKAGLRMQHWERTGSGCRCCTRTRRRRSSVLGSGGRWRRPFRYQGFRIAAATRRVGVRSTRVLLHTPL